MVLAILLCKMLHVKPLSWTFECVNGKGVACSDELTENYHPAFRLHRACSMFSLIVLNPQPAALLFWFIPAALMDFVSSSRQLVSMEKTPALH